MITDNANGGYAKADTGHYLHFIMSRALIIFLLAVLGGWAAAQFYYVGMGFYFDKKAPSEYWHYAGAGLCRNGFVFEASGRRGSLSHGNVRRPLSVGVGPALSWLHWSYYQADDVGTMRMVLIPFWLPALVLAMLLAHRWLHPPRRRTRGFEVQPAG